MSTQGQRSAEVTPPSSQDGKQGRRSEGAPSSTTNSTHKTGDKPAAATAPKASIFERMLSKVGLTPTHVVLMIKGALPPVLILASYRATAYADIYTTLGYLSGIMAVLSMAFRSRARFIQQMTYSVLFICLAAALSLLLIQCAVSARNTTSSASASEVGSSGSEEALVYNAAANTVAAVWLFVLVYFVSTVRAYRHQLMLPCILYMIFIVIISVYAPKMPDMASGETLVRRLLISCLTGFAFATGVNFFVFPITSRSIANKQIAGVLQLIKGALVAHSDYMSTIDNHHGGEDKEYVAELATKATALKANMTSMGALVSKLKEEMSYAKKEIGYGRIGPKQYSEIWLHLVNVMLPVVGTSTLITIMETAGRRKLQHGSGSAAQTKEMFEALRSIHTEEWNEAISMSKETYIELKKALLDALTHIGLVIGVFPTPKNGGRAKGGEDIEKQGGRPAKPGEKDYSKRLKAAIDAFHQHRETGILRWCKLQGIDVPKSFTDNPEVPYSLKNDPKVAASAQKAHKQHELYILLYTEYLIYSIGTSILSMVEYVDKNYTEGKLAKKRLIWPSYRQLRKLILKALSPDDSHSESLGEGDGGSLKVWVGDSLNSSKKDPEHLPPETWLQKATDPLRGIPRMLQSHESSFALRTSVATLSIGILAFLRQTSDFFNRERGIWALIMIALATDNHAGRGINGLITRIGGTIVSTAAAIAIWYMCDQHAAAIIPILFLFLMGCMWFLLKNPTMSTVGVITMVTVVLTLGYELQDQKIGRAITTSNGQTYYKIYLLAPYRLVTVVIGLATAFVWTYFPYPVTTHATMRRDLAKTMYLLGNYYSCAHTTIYTRLHSGSLTGERVHGSPLYRLGKAQNKVFGKLVTIMANLRQEARFSKWEPTFGGRFPLETYNQLIDSSQHIFNYISLMVYCSVAFTREANESSSDSSSSSGGVVLEDDNGVEPEAERSEWLATFARATYGLRTVEHDLTSRLCLFAASLNTKQPLPPYLKTTPPFNLARRMAEVDPEILSVSHIREPCYAAFAVLEVSSALVRQEIESMGDLVRDLVGEVDFSFHVLSTAGASSPSSRAAADEDAGNSEILSLISSSGGGGGTRNGSKATRTSSNARADKRD